MLPLSNRICLKVFWQVHPWFEETVTYMVNFLDKIVFLVTEISATRNNQFIPT